MGITRTDLYTNEQNQLAQFTKALGHPARISIIQHLLRMNSCVNGDLVEEIGLAQPTISQHLRALKEIGLIKGTIEGVSVNYCIDPDKWNEIKNALADLFNMTSEPGGNCC
ncbi:MAG: metalloregulator ArsR/SmtB family transcription factor [Cyclobacteriaceae bacterium]